MDRMKSGTTETNCMTAVVYDGSHQRREELFSAAEKGVKFLCPKCGEVLIIVLDAEAVAKHQMHPGIYCSKRPRHFFEMVEFRAP